MNVCVILPSGVVISFKNVVEAKTEKGVLYIRDSEGLLATFLPGGYSGFTRIGSLNVTNISVVEFQGE
jgi:hypothetical protein